MDIPPGIWIAFLSGFAWAGLDIARKTLTGNHGAVVIAAGLSMGSALLFALANLFGVPQIDFTAYVRPGLLSIVLGICTQILILQSLRVSSLSRTIPMLSLTPVATSLFGFAVLNERPSGTQWIGIALVFIGALALGLTRREGDERWRLPEFDRGAMLMLLAALSISAAAPFDKLAVAASSTRVHGFIQSLGSSVLLLLLLVARGDIAKLTGAFRARPAMSIAALLAFLAIALQFAAYRSAMVGEVETIKRVVGLLSSLGAGFFVFREKLTWPKILAVCAMAVGIALILIRTAPA